MIRSLPGEFTVKSLRLSFMLLSGLSLGLLFASAGLAAQNPVQPRAPKYRTHFVIYDVQKKSTTNLFTVEGEWHAPNWAADGKYFVSDMGGSLYRIPVSGANNGTPEKINVSQNMTATNDHALSWDGKQIAVSSIAHNLALLIMDMDGSNVHDVHMGWLHGWSPDGKYVVDVKSVKGNPDIYRVGTDGSGELRMTTDKAADDGPEYSADGKWVYFWSKRSGKWDAWRMPADGAGPDDKLAEKITNSEDTQDWFPHISPDGKWLYTISYPIDHPDHNYIGESIKVKLLRLKDGVGEKGAELTTVRTFFGGQGAGNTGGWSPDSKKFAWTEYEPIPEQAK
jgi:TolB protein